ncbi:MAG: SDR family oxidoreductase [Actinomycetota bacterium]|nr:SDR family oxidoreductase [Actinomycetota bacterium]
MSIFAVTGAASGIGAATRRLLLENGHEVVGVDLGGADITADLGTADGRASAVCGIERACAGRLDGLVTAAGIGGSSVETGGPLTSINYFGTVRVVEGLRGALTAARGAVVCVSSNSATCQPGWPVALAETCLAGDEIAAFRLAEQGPSMVAYAATKAAVAWWVRTCTPQWSAFGVRVNAVAPGLIETPLVTKQRQDPLLADAIDTFPIPRGMAGQPEEVAAVIDFLLSPKAALLHGCVVFADGGTDAQFRPRDWPSVWLP